MLTVTQAGLYWVETTDSCGNLQRDTIVINDNSPAVNAGPDRIKCNADTLHLSAPAGYLSYHWSTAQNTNTANSASLIINPPADISYYLKAEKLPGCFAYDTVRITVLTSSALALGPDKSFCEGDSAVLTPLTGFAQYQWNNGSSAPAITVYQEGSYSLIGTATNGCRSFDTLRIISTWKNPVVQLDDNPELCQGSGRTLDAGGPFSSYLWNDLSNLSTLQVTATGIYHVKVTDHNGCSATDTVRIVSILPPPADYLPSDTAICSYGTLVLKANTSFQRYSWSTGSAASSISISAPGVYWLDATNFKGCTGRDSVLVRLKECLTGFHIPTAFTPNGDGRNEYFRPVIGGLVSEYRFTIYNRWGETVFNTSDPAKGWDGKVKGAIPESNVFIWSCSFRLNGNPLRTEKGSVILVK